MLTTLAVFTLAHLPLQFRPIIERPRDIWAFRSVLDNRARILTIALNKDLWVAYDATNCGLYRAWTGGVKFDGAVYTTVHGPQPTSMGLVHQPGIVDRTVWHIERDGRTLDVKPEFKGYRFQANRITLQYRFRLLGREVWVYEQPEFGSAGKPTFHREFTVRGLSGSERVGFDLLSTRGSTKSNGALVAGPVTTIGEKSFDSGTLWLNRTGATTLDLQFDPAEPGNLFASIESDRGYKDAEEGQDPESQGPRMPGLAVRMYYIGQDLSGLPKLLAGQTPNRSIVSPTIDFKNEADFGLAEQDQFYVIATGFLKVSIPGEYEFRLTSDDGSKFMIRDEVIINHDGLHGAEPPKTGKFRLNTGDHPIVVEMFESQGDAALRLEWKKPGDAEFTVIPSTALSTPEGEVRVTSPGKKGIFDPANRWRPGDGRPLDAVHPSFTLETVRPKEFRPRVGGMDFLPDGRLVVCTWDPDGAVYVLDGVNEEKPHDIKVTRIAAGLAEPLGLKVVDGTIYVLQKQELTRLKDLDGDGLIDEYFAVANGWGVTANFHEFAFGLDFDKGYFYGCLAIAIDPGGRSTQPQNKDRGKVIKISPNGDFEFVASGLRTPNGIGHGAFGQLYITDNQGDWLPSSKLLHLRPGAFYGNRSVDPVGTRNRQEDPPVVWLPQGEIGNSPSNPAPISIGPFKGQMIHGDVTHGGVKRVFVERVDGQLQGCAFRFTQGLEAGINRILWGPDGKSLFVGGIGSTGNWGQEGKERFGLQRLTWNGKPCFEILAMRAKSNGMELEFTQPIRSEMGNSPDDYMVLMWRYVPTSEYGGPKIDERPLKVKSVTVSADRKRAFLELPAMKAGHVVYVKVNRGLAPKSSDELLWSTEAWYTLNRIPESPGRVSPEPSYTNVLSPEELKQGFELLFDGKTVDKWRGYKKDTLPTAWRAIDGELRLVPGGQGGDIVTKAEYQDFELRLEWKVAPGGNSGIFFRVSEDQPSAPHTGPEMQILDDDLAPDGRSRLTSAGSNYALHAPARDVARPAGAWQEVRIIAKGNDIEYWMNGYRIVRYTINSPEWNALVAKSKFASLPLYGKIRSGHIDLQDHGNPVSFRNIRIRRL